MSSVEKNSNTPNTPNTPPENTTRVPSPLPPPPSPTIEKFEKEISKSPTQIPDSLTVNNEKPKLHLLTTRDYVVRIDNDSTVEDDESIWDGGDQPTSYNLTRKLSSVEEDVCYPLRNTNKGDGIDYEALEEYIMEENTSAKRDYLSPSPIDGEPKRRVSEFGERIRSINEVKEEFRFVFYSIETGTIKAKTLATIPPEGKKMTELLKQGIFWLDVLAPTETEMRILSSIFRIHPLTMEDIETEETREKCELFKNYYFVSFRSHNNGNLVTADVEPINMYNVVMREGILTFHFQPTPHQHNVRKRIQHLKDFITLTPDWINYAIMDDVTDYFAPLIQKVEFESDAIDQLVMVLKKSEQQDMLVRIGLCRKLVMTLLKMLGTKVDVIKGLIKRFEDKLFVSESDKGLGDVTLYLGDIQDHIITMLQNLNHYENMLSRAHSNYLAQISIEITQLSNATNDFLNRMTVFATILLPMNVITGLFGMNVRVPGENGDLGWFFGIIGGFFLVFILGSLLARRFGLM
ncbi:hypothetical protein RclHR1_13050001 [Rhizophagus clarus]|uniref:Cora-domain-containing protein n=1 Tax=Rhizophagus clarus TaxID=94130 RepID=A0A2Z6QDP5_9GLOM|nr:hypothetical protein RclHR1_13050001 [Rhizophagus clarus]GES86989.1 cora-domain-containing protein [Rhizophagus clarus]